MSPFIILITEDAGHMFIRKQKREKKNKREKM